ncbi:hypothetical protein K438DRAFT_1960549 [Mycena galopus ATCC 62051]|nr:hypothetical protein K438DRAFT_1960549 [Mycena galopus ATCC 62051]
MTRRKKTPRMSLLSSTSAPHPRKNKLKNDGNLIFSALGVLFRVFKGILTAWSPVFADMLADGDGDESAVDILDGCPVLHLDNSAADTMYFSRRFLIMREWAFLL